MNAVTLAGRPIAMFTTGVLLASGLVFVAAAAPSPAAAALADGIEGFLVSPASTGTATGVDMTPDAQHVAFVSTATDLVDGGLDTNGVSDVFLSSAVADSADPFSGDAVLISVGIGGAPADGGSSEPTVSADGRYVAFTSTATNLVPDATTPGRRHVYVRDVLEGTTVRMQSPALGEPNGDSYDPDFSADGRSLVFTSDASNLDANRNGIADDDPNGKSDVFLVDRDPDLDGIFDAVQPVFVFPNEGSLPEASYEPAISGDGTKVVFTAEMDGLGGTVGNVATPGLPHVWRVNLTATPGVSLDPMMRLSRYASHAAIDSGGNTVVFLVNGICGATGAMVVASLVFAGQVYNIAIGTRFLGTDFGTSSNPAVSANGQTITWQSTQPFYDTAAPPTEALTEPVVRVQDVPAFDAWVADRTFGDDVECSGIKRPGWSDLAVGTGPAISAGGRTVAYSGPAPAPLTSSADTTVIALDRHTNAGVTVSTTQGQLAAPPLLAAISPADIPASEIRGYAAALANAPIHRIPIHRIPIHRIPIHRIPIHRIPIHRIPIHRIPIHRIPIHRIDIPGGWTELLVGTPFENQAPQTIIFGDVLDWAAKNAPDDSAATPAERAAAQRIQTLTLGDLELDNSGIDALTLASLVLGNAKLSQVHIGGTGTDTERWNAVVRAQGLLDDQGAPLVVGAETVLAELDFAGLDMSRTGIEAVSLASLPISDTLLDTMPAKSLILDNTPIGDLPVSALTETAITALWGGPRSGTIAQYAAALSDAGTAADLARGVPSSVTFGDLLFSVIDRASFPWEQIDPATIDFIPRDSTSPTCQGGLNCQNPIMWQFAFDPAPGEPTVFPSPLVTLELPGGSAQGSTTLQGSGPGYSRPSSEYSGASVSDGEHVEFPFSDTLGGTTLSFTVFPRVTTNPAADATSATLTSGQLSDTEEFDFGRDLAAYDDGRYNYDPATGQWPPLEARPEPLREDLVYYGWISTAYFTWNEDLGKNELGPAGDEDYYEINPPPPGKRLVISTNASDGQILMSLYSAAPASSPLGVASAGTAPGTPVTEQAPGTRNSAAETGADAGIQLENRTLVDQAAVGGSGSAQVEAAGLSSTETMVLRVSSGNGLPSDALYSVRVQYVDEPVEQVCAPSARPLPANRPVPAVSDAVDPLTNTVYVIDSQRFDETYGAGTASTLRTQLHSLDGKGTVGPGTVHSAVISVDEAGAVRTARDALLDGNPCSMSARAALTTEINSFVEDRIEGIRSQVTSVVIVGGDDMIPLAPVAQHTSQFNEASHAADLRRAKQADGSACPASVEIGAVDPCATPVSAAAATNYILTDDAYGLAQAYESLGGRLYVPTVGVGRLVETPAQIAATLARFVASNGQLDADSTLTAGYGPWSELPDSVTAALDWRTPAGNASDLGDSWTASQVTGLLKPTGENALSPRVISLNAHADESRLLPGVPGAASGVFLDSDLLNASTLTNASQLAGAVVFTIGCHAGGNLPTAYYGDVADWVDVFSAAGGYVGNTGYGLASSTTTALSERLLALYADWIGTSSDNGPVSSAGALTYAKQSYLGGFGLYSGYDEKALMESVYYGLPMYTFKAAAEPKEMPLPKLPPGGFSQLPVSGTGLSTASLSLSPEFKKSSQDAAGASFLIAGESGAGEEPATFQRPLVIEGQPVLPSLLYQLQPAPPGMVARGALITELSSAFEDAMKPAIAKANLGVTEPSAPFAGGAFPSVFAQIMHQLTPNGTVDTVAVTPGRVEMGVNGAGQAEKFTDMDIDVIYGPSSSDDDIPPIIRSIQMKNSWLDVIADGTGSPVSNGILLIQRQNDAGEYGGAWTPFPMAFTMDDDPATPFGYKGEVEVPVGDGNPYRWFLQVVDAAGNVAIDTSRGQLAIGAAPTPELAETGDATVTVGQRLLRTIEVTNAKVTDALTANVTLSDPSGTSDRRVTALVQVGEDGKTRVVVDEVLGTVGEFTATVEVCNGAVCGTTGFDLTVEPAKLKLPTITALATNAGGAYAADTWSRSAVTVTFACTEGTTRIVACPDPVVVDPDTSAAGVFVEGTAEDADGETATAGLWVKVDAADPELDPVVSPSSVKLGENAVAAPHASDAASGIASASCEQPDTTTPGVDKTVMCTATDKAGNTASAEAHYTVTAEPQITAKATVDGVPYVPGTWTRGPVDVTFTCSGGTDPIWCPGQETVSDDTGANGYDVVGKMRSGDFDTVVATATILVKVDTTAPTLKPVVTPSPVVQNKTATVAANASDEGGSGVLLSSVSCTPIDTSKVGTFPVTCTATDNVGNASEGVTVNYTVIAPVPVPAKCRGLLDRTALPPLNADGSSVFLRTSGVPVVFAACDAKGNPISAKKFVKGVTLVSKVDLTTRTVNELWYPPVQPFSYVKKLGVWTGNIATAKLATGKKYTYRVDLADGTSFTVTFGVR